MPARRHSTDAVSVPNSQAAMVLAYDELTARGCRGVVVETPHQTTHTWIVHATCGDSACDGTHWRVHIDPRSGATRIVETAG